MPVVFEHGAGGIAGRPTDRPDVLPALPKGLQSLATVRSEAAVRALDGAHAVLGLDPGATKPDGSPS
eukprot:9264930-Alexandrium_andersonii.AAC.1